MGETMGLDMYAYMTDTAPAKPVDFPEPENSKELHYWRKHPNLHGWMQQLYEAKGGENPDFNVATVRLESGDLEKLEAAITENELPETCGFFFGDSDGSECEDDLEFVAKARVALGQGKVVFYYAWW
jgi:hypothetical protein